MTKKQLEKYQKEFDEFVANVEKMGGRFLTEDELRYKINGGVGGGDDGDAGEEQTDDSPAEGGGTDEFASAPTEATADGAGETQAGNENEDSSGKSEETAEEDDDKSCWESVCEAVGGVVDAVGDAVSGLVDTVTDAVSDAAHAVGEVIEDVIDFFTGGSGKADNTVTPEGGSEPANPTSPKATEAAQDKSAPENGKTNTSGDMTVDSKNLSYDSATGTFRSNPTLSDVNLSAARPENNLAAAMEAANGKSKETVNQDEISLNLEPIENKKSSFNFEYDENLCRGYYSGNQNIGLGAGGWISSTSLDNPKSIADDNGMHFMNIQISDNTTVHLDNIYIGCRISL